MSNPTSDKHPSADCRVDMAEWRALSGSSNAYRWRVQNGRNLVMFISAPNDPPQHLVGRVLDGSGRAIHELRVSVDAARYAQAQLEAYARAHPRTFLPYVVRSA